MKTFLCGALLFCGATLLTAAVQRTILGGTISPCVTGETRTAGTISRQTLMAAELSAVQSVRFVLKLRHFEDLRRRIERGEILSIDEMKAHYLPAPETWARVADWAESQGMTVSADPTRLSVNCRTTVRNAEAALGTKFARVIGNDGREYTSAVSAPSVPADFAESLVGILDLQPHCRPIHKQITVTQPTSWSISPTTIAQHYNSTGLGLDGTGETIVVLGYSAVAPGDLAAFWGNCGLPTTIAQFQEVDPFPGNLGSSAQASEETMDIEWASAMAPGAKILYFSSDAVAFAGWLYGQLPADQSIHQLTISFALPEGLSAANAVIAAHSQAYALLAAAGVTVFAASGDEGSTPDVVNGVPGNSFFYNPNGTTMPDYPASDPFVTGVGGTTILFARDLAFAAALPLTEGGWCLPNDQPHSADYNLAASSGGVSGYFARPAWQVGPNLPAGNWRAVPDVAAMAASNFAGYYFFAGNAAGAGGTSLSSPIWGGLCALLNQARRQAGLPSLGLLGPKIYPLIGTPAFNQMTSGAAGETDGFSTTATNGAYPVGPNYNLVTGLGSPNIAELVAALTVAGSGVAPVFTIQPATVCVAPGATATYAAVATGAPLPSYQWTLNAAALIDGVRFDGSVISGSTTNTLTITNAQPINSTIQSIAAIATNVRGVAVSKTVLPPVPPLGTAPVVISSPKDRTVVSGTGVTLGADFYGSAPMSYVWYKDAVPIPAATTASYTIPLAKVADAGAYRVTATNGDGTATSGIATLSVGRASAAVVLDSLGAVYDGSAHAVTAQTVPSGLAVGISYNGSFVAPTSAGSYAVIGTITDAEYTGSAAATLVIAKATPVIAWATPAPVIYGSGLSLLQLNATADIAGAFIYSPPAAAAPNAGTHTITAVFTPTDTANYSSVTVERTLVVTKATVGLSLSNQSQYDGNPKPAIFTTGVADLNVVVTYDGGDSPPIEPGNYAVVATVVDANYQGSTVFSYEVLKGSPQVTWNPPATIPLGEPVGPYLHPATANLPGVFSSLPPYSYAPPLGTYVFSLRFVPTDSAHYREVNLWRTVDIVPPTAPAITINPVARTVVAGWGVTFVAGASGFPAPSFQWQKDGVNIANATGEVLAIGNVTHDDAGAYWVVATNSAGTATGIAAVLTVIAAGTTPADFNGDAKPDLIWSNSQTGERALWLMNGTNYIAASTLGIFPLEWTIAATGDFNGDGKPDIVWSNSQTGERALWLMNGTNLLGVSTLGIFPLEWTVAATGDFNGDGKPDIVWSNSVTGERALWLMDGTTRIGVSTLGVFPLEWTVAATGDFNGDGKPDLVWSNSITGERALWLMDGTTRIGVSTLGMFPLEWTIAGTADFNGDGKPDIIWSNSVTGERALWLMDGTQFIAASTLGIFPLEWTASN